jgi:PKD repeat protein
LIYVIIFNKTIKEMMIYMKQALVVGVILLLFSGFLSGCIFPKENVPPQANLIASSTFVDVDEGVIFSANLSVDKDGEIVKYFWDLGDGTNLTGKFVEHHYETGGNYTVILIITDNDGKKALQTITVHVNELPVPRINISIPAYIHEPVYFYANYSYDTDGFVNDYFWDFSDGTNASGMSVDNIFTVKEQSWVTLTVTDNDGAKAATTLEFPILYRTYRVRWVIEDVLVDAPSGYLAEEESEHLITQIDVLNLTKISFNLTWDDDFKYIGEPPLAEPEPNDDFVLNVTSEDDEYFEKGPSTSQKIVVFVPKTGYLNPKPKSFDIEAESEDVLEELMAINHTTENGTGDWAINITLLEAGGLYDLPTDIDNGNSWQLMVVCHYYTFIITKLE